MKKKNVLLFLFDGFSDWESSYVSVGVTKSDTHRIRTLALDKSPVRSMGGMTVLPDSDFIPQIDLPDIDETTTAMLVLPGGDWWLSDQNRDVQLLVIHCLQHSIPVAAICGATVFIARAGLLNTVRHTSNDLEWLKAFSPDYTGEPYYQYDPCVSDQGIITANGISAIEFADRIFEELQIVDQSPVKAWFQYFQNKTVIC